MPHAFDKSNGWSGARLVTEVEYLSQRLSYVHDSLMKVKRVVEEKETDICILDGHEERLKSIHTNLQRIKHDMPLIDDFESLAGKAAGLEETSFEIQVSINRLLKNIKSEYTVSKRNGILQSTAA